MSNEGMYMRLADFPVPRRWWWWGLLVLLLARDGRRNRRKMKRTGKDLGKSVVARWEQVDAATAAMLKLNRTMVRLTWAVVALTLVALGVTLYLGLR
jgi:hypothetical protein